jgi:hypothetical protein
MQKPDVVYGLPWPSTKPERAIFDELKYGSVYAVGPVGGRPLRIGASTNLKKRVECLQPGSWKELTVHHVIWATNDVFANRILADVVEILEKSNRRLTGDWFDITPEFATQAIRLACERSNFPVLTHGEMLAKVRDIRQTRLDKGIVVRKR